MIEINSPVDFFPTSEVFKPITEDIVPGIYNWYLISNFGNVYSLKSDRLLKPSIDSKGYLYIILQTNNGPKAQRIHRLVLLAFDYQEGCENKIVNHIDGIKVNPKVYNLEWTDYSGNARHAYDTGLIDRDKVGGKSKISDDDIRKVCELLVENKLSAQEIADIVGTSRDTVFAISNRKAHTKISKEYNLSRRKPELMTDNEVINLCNYFQNNPIPNNMYKKDYVIMALNQLGMELTPKNINCGERILRRKSFGYISKDYNF